MRKCENCGAPVLSDPSTSQRCRYCGVDLSFEANRPSRQRRRGKRTREDSSSTPPERVVHCDCAHPPRPSSGGRPHAESPTTPRSSSGSERSGVAIMVATAVLTLGGILSYRLWRDGKFSTSQATTIYASWSDNAVRFRGEIGRSVQYVCPAGSAFGSVWGDVFYSDDSSVCTAAVHAGRLNPRTGGVVTIQIASGRSFYTGTSRNGVTSSNYGRWPGSFTFLGPVVYTLSSSLSQQRSDQRNLRVRDRIPDPLADDPRSPKPPDVSGTIPLTADWSTNLQAFRGTRGRLIEVICPPGGSAGYVWGTNVYSDHSSVCTAGVHAGRITFESGGVLRVVLINGRSRYVGSTRNGVTSSSYGRWPGSFMIR